MRFLDKRNSFKEFNQSRVLSHRFSGENSSFVDVCHAAILRGAHDDRVNYRNCKLGFCMGSTNKRISRVAIRSMRDLLF